MSFRINRQLAEVEIHLKDDFGPVGQISQVGEFSKMLVDQS